jgi:hypothetical protein
LDEDATLAFLDKDGDLLADCKPAFISLPVLLEARRHGIRNSAVKQQQWRSKILFCFTKKPMDPSIGRRQWRPYAHRNIPFTRLGTPPSDAVLAMDRTGSYVLSLGTMDNAFASPGLALRFYGIPSPMSVQQRRIREISRQFGSKAPLLQSVPLLRGVGNLLEGRQGRAESSNGVAPEDVIFNFQGNVSPGSTPVKVLISKDWKLGLALVRRRVFNDSTGESQAETTGTMVLFTLPQSRSNFLKVYTCRNVEMENSTRESSRNLLWRIHVVPCPKRGVIFEPEHSIRNFANVPGYVVFNDEGDGYRITWCTEDLLLSDKSCRIGATADSSPLENPTSPSASIITRQQTWEESLCDNVTGDPISLMKTEVVAHEQLSVVHEAYLHIDILLADILSRRKGFSETHPDFFFSLISLRNAGRVANMVVAFARKWKACSVGIFVYIDLFTGKYEELDWVKDASADPTEVKTWCTKLAINRRMKHVRAGPYAVSEKSTVDWSCIVKDTNAIDYDEEDDYDEGLWGDFVHGKGSRTTANHMVPKVITLSSLYPDCVTVSNDALLHCEPVKSMRAREAPIQLLYG